MPTPVITTHQAVDSVADLLQTYQSAFIQSQDPLVNQELKRLLGELYETKRKIDPNSAPLVIDMSGASTAEIIAVLLSEMRKTNDMVAATTTIEIRQQQNKIIAKNDDQLSKLKDAEKAAKEAKELSDGLGIFKWVMLAVSILAVIISAVVTICTFGAATKVLVAAVIVLAISIAMVVATSVPVDDEKHSAMDLASKGLSDSIAAEAKAAIIERYGERWKKMSDAEQEEALLEATETGQYSSMAIMITISIAISIAMVLLTAGAGSGSAATAVISGTTNTAQAAGNTTASTASRIATSVSEALRANAPAIMQQARNLNYATAATKAAGTIAQSGVGIESASYREDAAMAQAAANDIKAITKYMEQNNERLLEIVAMLQESSNASYTQVANIIKNQHASNTKIIANMAGASSV